jgi:hypothetical protein
LDALFAGNLQLQSIADFPQQRQFGEMSEAVDRVAKPWDEPDTAR